MDAHLFTGDCLEIMQGFDADCIDSIITDPPYGIGFLDQGWDHEVPGIPYWAEMLRVAKPGAILMAFGGTRKFHRLACAIEDAGWVLRDCIGWIFGSGWPKGKRINIDMQDEATAEMWDGWHTGLRPGWEPIIVAMKPIDGTFMDNALNHGVAGFWVDGCKIESKSDPENGRFPANLIHDGSEEIEAVFPHTKSGSGVPGQNQNLYGIGNRDDHEKVSYLGDQGSASRYFYTSKASQAERHAGVKGKNKHPTVKPISLMRYLCRLSRTPTGGIVMDPFCGSGSTGCGAAMEDRSAFVGIDIKPENIDVSKQRIAHWGGALLTRVNVNSTLNNH